MSRRKPVGRQRGHTMLDQYARSVGTFVNRRRTERALGAAKTEAELSSRAKTNFLANMSHELRTPLNAIIGFSQMLSSRAIVATLENERYEYAEHIEQAGQHLLGIISDILDMSKIDTGAMTTELAPARIADLLAPCEMMLRERIQKKRQSFKMTFGPDLSRIDVDARRFKQVVINILSNANKFTPEDGRIELSAWQAEDDHVEIVITDTGVGMTEDEMAIALQPFGQVQSAYNRAHEGTGLGLPIARRLTELQGGMFHLASEVGQGTRVTLTFPCSDNRLSARPAETKPAAEAASPAASTDLKFGSA